jgi:fibronectin type III domain protein
MAKVRLNLRNLSTLEIVDLGRRVVRALTGNTAFPSPHPPLATLTAGLDGLETANNDLEASRQETAKNLQIRDDKQVSIVALLRQSAAFVESVAGDDESVILSAGMDVRSAPSFQTQPAGAPGNLSGSQSDHEGEIDLHWDTVKGASYEIQRSADPATATSWQHAAVSVKSSVTISGLVSGTRYWFRVAAVTSAGQSGWSDPATKIAP